MRIRYICFLLSMLINLVVNGQDPSWETVSINQGASVSMPGPTTLLDTVQAQAINSQLNGFVFQLKYIKPKYEVKNGDELMQAYDGFLKGYLNTGIRVYINTVSDTSLQGTMGEWIHSRYSKDAIYSEMYTYLVLVNSYFYMITLAADRPIKADDPILHQYFTSLQFPQKPIKENSGDFPLQARSYRTGQHIGRMTRSYFPYVLGIFIITLVAVLVNRKFRRKKGK